MSKAGLFIISLLGCVAIYFFYEVTYHTAPSFPIENNESHKASYPLADFYPGIEQAEYQDAIPGHIYGGIVSHHLLTSDDIAKFFSEFRLQKPSTIVIVGPNHFSVGEESIAVSKRSFLTPWGEVKTNTTIVDALLERRAVFLNEEPFVEEHSIAALVSYVAYNFPEAKIVPIVTRREVARTQLDRLAIGLSEALPDDAVVIASVDFSHHLNKVATEFHDAASVSAITNFDFDRIFNLEIDSPSSIYTILKYLDARGARKVVFKNTDSTDYTGNVASEDLTSYVFGHFVVGDSTTSTVATSLHFGDMMFARGVGKWIDEKEGDPFHKIQGPEGNFLRGVDITMANFEGVITMNDVCDTEKEVIIKSNSESAALLKKYRFNGVTLANNHSFDCFENGLKDTVDALETADLFAMLPAKPGDLAVLTKNVGYHRVALLAMNALGMEDEDLLSTYREIEAISQEHDSVVLHVHWGYEYDTEPTKEQQIIARRFIDAGVDAVIGHHPHVVQRIERYNEGMIFYSVGNFIFDQPGIETRTGFGVGLVHSDGPIAGYLFPYEIKDFQPTLFSYEPMERYCEEMLGDLEKDIPCKF